MDKDLIGEEEVELRRLSMVVNTIMDHREEQRAKEAPKDTTKIVQPFLTLTQSVIGLIVFFCTVVGFWYTTIGSLHSDIISLQTTMHSEIQSVADRTSKVEYISGSNVSQLAILGSRADKQESVTTDISERLVRIEAGQNVTNDTLKAWMGKQPAR